MLACDEKGYDGYEVDHWLVNLRSSMHPVFCNEGS